MTNISPELRAMTMDLLLEQGLALELSPSQSHQAMQTMAASQGLVLDPATARSLDLLFRGIIRESGALQRLALQAGIRAEDAYAFTLLVMSGKMDISNLNGWALWTSPALRSRLFSFLAAQAGGDVAFLAQQSLALIDTWAAANVQDADLQGNPMLPPGFGYSAPAASELFANSPKRTARIGAFGDLAFEVSAQDVFTLHALSRKRSATYARHETLNGRPLLQSVGLELWEIEISVKLDRNWCDPEARIAQLEQAQAAREHQPLAIGGRAFGNFVLQSLDEAVKRLGGTGEILVAEVKLSFVEHWEPEGGSVILSRSRPPATSAVRKRPAVRTAATDWNQAARDSYSGGMRTDLRH